MKKIGLFLIIVGLVFLPFSVKAAEKKYNTLDLKQTLADEEIEEAFKEYKPNSDAITIYLFRGKGCGYCRAFLTFLNSITDEYGKYFNLEAYEVWNDQDNATLMGEVSEYMGEVAQGVPYIIIGDKVFPGYAESYDEGIKDAIKTLYDTKKNKRYDVFAEMKKNPKKNASNGIISSDESVIWSLVFTFFAIIVIVSFVNLKFKELNHRIDELNEQLINASHKNQDVVSEKKNPKKAKK